MPALTLPATTAPAVSTTLTPRSAPAARLQHAPPRRRVRRLSLQTPSRPRAASLEQDELEQAGRPVGTTTPPAPLPDPTAMCCAVVRAAIETLRAERPVSQLTRWVSPEIYEALARRARLTQAAGRPRPAVARPVQVRRARLVRLGDTAAEATVIVDDVDRVRAAAVRLEARRGTWRVVALELG